MSDIRTEQRRFTRVPLDAPVEVHVSTLRLVATLAVAGALAGLLIVLVNMHTKPIIDAYRAHAEEVREKRSPVRGSRGKEMLVGALSLLAPITRRYL